MKAKAAQTTKSSQEERIAAVAHRINIVLHTMRAIERHEDQLCTIMTEIRNSGRITSATDRELRDILDQIPAHEYLDDLDAVRSALTSNVLAAVPLQAASKKSKSKVPPRSNKAARRQATRSHL